MNPILIVRTEIVCLLLLIYLMVIRGRYRNVRNSPAFFRMMIYGVLHTTMDLLTVLTVNRLDEVPTAVNWVLHVVFYLLAILFVEEYLCYIVELIASESRLRKVRLVTNATTAVYLLVCLIFHDIRFEQGLGTNYSIGTAAYIGFGLVIVQCVLTIIVLLRFRNRISANVFFAITPVTIAMLVCLIVQVVVHEFLFTGACATIVLVGVFIGLESPTEVFRAKAYTDETTGMFNKNKYLEDCEQLRKEKKGRYLGIVVFDLNGMKQINDSYGHVEGDMMLRLAAKIIREHAKQAAKIYRAGGDEFIALYYYPEEAMVMQELAQVEESAEQLSQNRYFPLSIAWGYAEGNTKEIALTKLIAMADERMYENKARMKKNNPIFRNC